MTRHIVAVSPIDQLRAKVVAMGRDLHSNRARNFNTGGQLIRHILATAKIPTPSDDRHLMQTFYAESDAAEVPAMGDLIFIRKWSHAGRNPSDVGLIVDSHRPTVLSVQRQWEHSTTVLQPLLEFTENQTRLVKTVSLLGIHVPVATVLKIAMQGADRTSTYLQLHANLCDTCKKILGP